MNTDKALKIEDIRILEETRKSGYFVNHKSKTALKFDKIESTKRMCCLYTKDGWKYNRIADYGKTWSVYKTKEDALASYDENIKEITYLKECLEIEREKSENRRQKCGSILKEKDTIEKAFERLIIYAIAKEIPYKELPCSGNTEEMIESWKTYFIEEEKKSNGGNI